MKTRKTARKGVAYLIESELEKAELVLAARSIPDKLQTMAENLAKIEPDDVMPMLDGLKAGLGPQVADRFAQAVTGKVRELLDAMKAAKDAIDAEIANLQSAANGEPVNDITADAAAAAPPPADPSPPPTADAQVADAPPAVGNDTDEAGFDDLNTGGAAGRAKKESVGYRTNFAIRALREATNPDAMLLHLFRKRLSAGHTVSESVRTVAAMFSIDAQDVAAVVREAKLGKATKRPFERRGSKVVEASMTTTHRAVWNPDNFWFDIVDGNNTVVARDVAANEDKAVRLAANYKPGMVNEREGTPSSPKSRQATALMDERAVSLAKANIEQYTRKTLDRLDLDFEVTHGVVYVKDEASRARAMDALEKNIGLREKLPVRVRKSGVTESDGDAADSAKIEARARKVLRALEVHGLRFSIENGAVYVDNVGDRVRASRALEDAFGSGEKLPIRVKRPVMEAKPVPKKYPGVMLNTRPQGHGFADERAAIRAAREVLGGKAKKSFSFVTTLDDGKWGWIGASADEVKQELAADAKLSGRVRAPVMETKPVSPRSPADMRASQAQAKTQSSSAPKGVAPAAKPAGGPPAPPQPPKAPTGPKASLTPQQTSQPAQPAAPVTGNDAAKAAGVDLPGKVLTQAPKAPAVPQPAAKPAPAPGQPTTYAQQSQAKAPAAGSSEDGDKADGTKPGGTTLFSKTKPLPKPALPLIGAGGGPQPGMAEGRKAKRTKG